VSAAPASGLDAARVASDIVLTGQDLRALPEALRIGRLSVRRIRENFALSAIYNVVAVPIALVGLATPLLAALAMSASSITVSLNAMRLGGRSAMPADAAKTVEKGRLWKPSVF
jgi:Cu2+-exporting ATPase